MVFSTLRTSALIFAGLSLTSNAADDRLENAMWQIELDTERVEPGFVFVGIVSYDGKPLCDDGMNDAAATALCRHFELGNYGSFEGHQEVGTDDFGADNLECPDDAKTLRDCKFQTEFENCYAGEGVLLKCAMWTLQIPSVWEDHEHLIPRNMGMVHYNFKPLCDDHVDRNAADALCRTMNLGMYGDFQTETDAGTDEFSADNLICPENAQSIHDCEFIHEGEDCESSEGVFLLCHDGFRLLGESLTKLNEGFVVYRGQAVCDVGDMTPLAANLLCQNMHKGTTGVWETRDISGSEYLSERGFGADNPSCQRFETHLDECDFTVDEHLPCNNDKALYLTCSFDGWTMRPAIGDEVHGEDGDHSGFVYYNGKPLCDDFMSNREASMLCHTMYYGEFEDLSLGDFDPHGNWRGTWETRDMLTDDFGADNLFCPTGSDVQNINDCTWDTEHDCNSGEGVWLNCHKGWLLEESIWGNDEDKIAGFLSFDGKTVCKEGFNDHTANVMCRSMYGPSAQGVWQQKMNTSTMIWGQSPSVTLACPAHAHTVEECTRGEPEDVCLFVDAVHLECIL